MRAMVIRACGGRDVLSEQRVPDPKPTAAQVLVSIKACSLNHLDIFVRRGIPSLKLSFPHILGADIAGIVKEVGSDVRDVSVGQRVLVAPGVSCGHCPRCLSGHDNLCPDYGILGEHLPGGYAELIAVPAKNIFPIPDTFSFTDAAAFPLTFLTAWQMLVDKAHVRAGEWVLIHAAASGVGTAAVQIAKLFGANVIALASSDAKLNVVKKLGADHVLNSQHQDVAAEVKKLTASQRGVDVVVEHTGAATWQQSIVLCRTGGRIVTCGATSGWDAKTDLRHVFFRQLTIFGSTMGRRETLTPLLEHVHAGRLKPVIHTVLPLSDAAEGHRLLEEERSVCGKVVLEIS